MFEAITNRAQRAIETLVSRYVTRLVVTVPFVVALGFATASAAIKLTEMYGSMRANAILAGIFGGVGVIAAMAIAMGRSAIAEPALQPDTSAQAQNAIPNASEEKPALDTDLILAAIGAIGPASLPMVLRMIVRNLPLLIGVVALAYLLFSDAANSEKRTTEPARV